VQLLFMQSDGGLAPLDGFSGHKAVLSGPAGGYVGYALTTRWEGAAAAIAADTGADVRKLQVGACVLEEEAAALGVLWVVLFCAGG
jgi:N-methylhydantoinase A/oxoprolinase/acetone carboxylase beta subunit